MCGYTGCKEISVYEIQQTVGKKQKLEICGNCAPVWVKQMTPTKFYQVRKIGGKWVTAHSQSQEKATLDFLGKLAAAKEQYKAKNANEYSKGYSQQKERYCKKRGCENV